MINGFERVPNPLVEELRMAAGWRESYIQELLLRAADEIEYWEEMGKQ